MTTPTTSPQQPTQRSSRPLWTWLVLDIVAVVGFVALGRSEHDDDGSSSSALEVVAPFVVSLVLGWLAMRAWRTPIAARTGAGVWVITVAVGLLGRRVVFDDGTALAFIIVTTAFLGLTLNGWRLLVRAATSRGGGT